MRPRDLSASVHASSASCKPEGSHDKCGVRTYRWMQFEGKEHITEFDDSHFELEGRFESHSSAGHKEYQARLRVISLRKQGKGKTDIANILGRSERFVGKWWQKEEQEVPKPWGVHGFLGGEMGFEAVQSGATIGENTATDVATWWRDVEIRRGFAKDPAIYTEIMENACWEGLPSNTKDFRTGAAVMKYMKDGSVCKQSYQKAKYSPGLSPATDKALQKLFAEFGIEGRTVGVLLNRYDDGQAMLGSHRHDCWTALFSFGSERILTIDHTPLLCQDGDLVIFGTQRHGVPKMPEITTGRVTVVVFFYPNQVQKQNMWQTIADDNNAPSRSLIAIQHDTYLGSSAQDWALWGFGGKGYAALALLKRIGLVQNENEAAWAKDKLIRHQFNAELVAAILARDSSSITTLKKHAQLGEAPTPRGRWGRRLECNGMENNVNPDAVKLSVEDSLVCARVLARVVEGVEVSPPGLQEFPSGGRPVFKAEDWDGVSGDLVAHFLRGGNVRLQDLDKMIKLDEMTHAELISVGAGNLSERAFFDVLRAQDVRIVYDLRASESQRDMRTNSHPSPHFSTKSLRIACKARGILYKNMAIGRESAYGVLAHLKSAEGQHTLLELVWQAQRARAAFLGSETDWRQDARLAIAEELTRAGHSVEHLQTDGVLYRHEAGEPLPDWLSQEETKLRKIEKMRHAGELQRKNKSAVDRSTESVASRLMQKPDEVDTMSMLRDATNQQELKFAQRHLAAMQRYSEKYELPSKVLSGTPKFLVKEAHDQATWVEQRIKERLTLKQTGKNASAHCSDEDETYDFQVQCRVCDRFHSWSELVVGDGCCALCLSSDENSACFEHTLPEGEIFTSSKANSDHDAPHECFLAEELTVECSTCGVAAPWSLLSLGDGNCLACTSRGTGSNGMGVTSKTGLHAPSGKASVVQHEAASSSARWQRTSRACDGRA